MSEFFPPKLGPVCNPAGRGNYPLDLSVRKIGNPLRLDKPSKASSFPKKRPTFLSF
jgi:hypothetical protein